ncbi:MAG: glycosyltransferase family 2 protein, partial [Actinomycetota bacterium]|nr:glycosyltransferase family 2 protein [Actinomycetota bacterium]
MSLNLSIILVSYNTQDLLNNCLNSIFKRPGKHLVEIIVIDNSSTDGSIEMVKTKYPWVKLIENKENIGFAKANNQGFMESSGRYVMFLNSDTIAGPDSIDRIIDFMESHPEVDIVGPKLLNEDGSLQI